MSARELIRWGILGTGRMAREFAAALAEVENAQLVAIASRNHARAAEQARKYNISKSFGSYEQLAHQQDIDVVYVATPPALHKDHAALCLQAGKAVLCEKPFTVNASEARELIDIARARRCFLMEAMWTRFVPTVLALHRELQRGTIGDIQLVVAGGAFIPDFNPNYYLFRPELGGGVMLDAGVYLVSMASMLCGPIAQVLATGDTDSRCAVDAHDAVILRHTSGALANLYVSMRGRCAPDMQIIGSQGKITVAAPLFCPPSFTITDADGCSRELSGELTGNPYRHQIEEVHTCLRADRLESTSMGLDETLAIMSILDAIRTQISRAGLK